MYSAKDLISNKELQAQIERGEVSYVNQVTEYKIVDFAGYFCSSASSRFLSKASTTESLTSNMLEVENEIQVILLNHCFQ